MGSAEKRPSGGSAPSVPQNNPGLYERELVHAAFTDKARLRVDTPQPRLSILKARGFTRFIKLLSSSS